MGNNPIARLILDMSDIIAEWVAVRSPYAAIKNASDFGLYRAIGVEVDGKLEAGVVYNNYRPVYRTIDASVAADSPKWASRSILRGILSVPFDDLCVNRVTAVIGHTNERAQRFVKGIGFTREGCARYAFGDQHGVIFGMLKKEFEARYGRR